MAMLPVFMSILLLQALRISSTPEEAFLGYPMQVDDEDAYLYMDDRSDPDYGSMGLKAGTLRRRSILDKNFARFGRSGPSKPKMTYLNSDDNGKRLYSDDDVDDDRAYMERNARSGERSDKFIRFGRTQSDFVRFGRSDPHAKNRDFLRFGRNTRSIREKPATGGEASKSRKKRSPEVYKKSEDGSKFVRFGRERADNFMRFGRMLNANHMQPPLFNFEHVDGIKADTNGTDTIRKILDDIHGQQSHELLLRMLLEALTRTHLQKELHRLQENEQQRFAALENHFKGHKET